MGETPIEANAYAVAFRLLGDRPAASAVAGIAAQRLAQDGLSHDPHALAYLMLHTIDLVVSPTSQAASPTTDPAAGLRAALRRRLTRATPEERIAGSLVHLAGYPPSFVAPVIGRTEDEVTRLAGVLAAPPGVAYRQLGDPELTHAPVEHAPGARPPRSRRPGWVTIAAVVLVALAVFGATQMTGPRPTLGPPRVEQQSTTVPGAAGIDPSTQPGATATTPGATVTTPDVTVSPPG